MGLFHQTVGDLYYVPDSEDPAAMLGVGIDSVHDLIFRIVGWEQRAMTDPDDDGDSLPVYAPVCVRVDPQNPRRSLIPAMPYLFPGKVLGTYREALSLATEVYKRIAESRNELFSGFEEAPLDEAP